MAACLVKHYVVGDVPVARLNVVQSGPYTSPIACHHCEKAPCASACPVGALYKDGDRVGVRMERCIGCQSCVMACPFGAVRVVKRCDADRIGDLVVDAAADVAVIKCDRCYDRAEGPACVQACTSFALRVVDQDEVDTRQLQPVAAKSADRELACA